MIRKIDQEISEQEKINDNIQKHFDFMNNSNNEIDKSEGL